MRLSSAQAHVLVSILEGAGTTQRFGRWSRHVTDALQRRGLITVTHVPSEGNVYAIWRIDLTPAGKKERARLEGQIDPIPFPDYPVLQQSEMCLHDPQYPAGKWRCVLRRGHSEFHRYMPEL